MVWKKAFHVLWRRLWLQSVRRHYLALGLEVLSVVFIARLAVPGSAPREKPQKLSMKTARLGPDAQRPYAHAEPTYFTTETVVYGPQNAATDALVKAAFPKASTWTAVRKWADVEGKCRAAWANAEALGRAVCVRFSEVFGATRGGSLEYELLQATDDAVAERLPLTSPKSFKMQGETVGRDDYL
ncbi:hypothetical protein MTO96_045270, partial [Rhipicephalus appendiculatus]